MTKTLVRKKDFKSKDESEFPWRKEEAPNAVSPLPPSRGLDAHKFHRSVPKQGDEFIASTTAGSVQQEILQLKQKQDLRRSAFKDETELHAWHTQEQAFRHFDRLQREYLGEAMALSQEKENSKNIQSKEGRESSQDSMASMTPSSGSSQGANNNVEPKRRQTNRKQSPAKSTLRSQYREEFLQEHIQKGPIPLDLSCHRALWSMEPRIWSIEKSSSGKRKYIVGQTGRLMDRYWRHTDRESRHYYELIATGQSCRLYLDLEFSKVSNPGIDCVEELLRELWEDLSNELHQVYPEQIPQPPSRRNVVDLDATTDSKFSRHWIVHLPGAYLFRDTAALGRFVQNWIGRLAEQHATKQLADKYPLLQKYLFLNPAPSKSTHESNTTEATVRRTCIVDLGVYTRNRLFRLMGSTKFGKPSTATLRIADTNEFPFPDGFGNHSFYGPALKSDLHRHLDEEQHQSTVHEFVADVEKFKSRTDWSLHAEALALTMVVPLNATKMDFPILPVQESQPGEQAPCHHATFSQLLRKQGVPTPYNFTTTFTGASDYPAIDKFVHERLSTRGGTQGSIRAWSIERDENDRPISITYQMSRNRWCECIQRAHRSNNIYWVVDLVLWHCVQRCHDPDCRALNFRGTPVPLPDDVREVVQQELIDEELARLDEETLLNSEVGTKSGTTGEDADLAEGVRGDEEFEAALMALNLGPSQYSSESPNHTQVEPQRKQALTNAKTIINTKESEGHGIDLSEDALLEAMMENPELFP